MRTLVLISLLGLAACGPKTPRVEPAADGTASAPATDAEGNSEAETPDTPPPPTAETAQTLDSSSYEQINEAVRLLDPRTDAHDPAAAKTILAKVVADDPSIAVAHLNLGVAKHQLGDLAGARSSYMSAADLDKSLGQVELYMGRLQEQAGRADLALAQYKAAVEKSPDEILLREALVGGLVQAGEIDEAIRAAKAALQVNTQSVALYNSLGLAYIEKGEYALARFVYEKARNTVQGADENASIHANLGRVLRMQEDLPNARFHLTRAVSLDDTYVPGLVHLADLYMEDRNYVDAVGLLEKAKALAPRNFWIVVNLGVAYRGKGDLDKAQAEYEAAMALDAEASSPHFNLGILEGDYRKEYGKGIKALQAYIDMGGAESERAEEYIASLEKEKRRADRRREREEARKKAEAEAAERQRLLEQESGDTEPSTPETPEGGGDSPWGEGEAPAEGGGEP